MLVAVLASRILGLVRDMLITWRFGQGAAASAYALSFVLPDTLYFFLSSGALSSAFIPVFTERFSTNRQQEAWEIFSTIACLMGIVLGAAIIMCEVFTLPLVTYLVAPGYRDNAQLTNLIVSVTRIILPCQLFFFVGGLMMGTLEARQNFKARAAGPVIYNLGIIVGAVFLSRWFSIAGLAWGALGGAFFGNVVFAFIHMRREGFEFHPSLNLRHPGVKKVGALALPVILGLSLPQIDVIINRIFASFVSDAAPAAINNANRLMQVPLGIFAQAAGTAILPMLAMYAAKNAIAEMRSGIAYGLRTILVENIPSTLFMVVMADPIVRTVYMSGEFKPSDVPVTAIALAFYSAGIFAWAGQAIVARGFFALQDTLTPVLIGTVSTAVFVPLCYVLMKLMGVGGIALSTTIGATMHFFLLTWFLRKRLGGIEGRKTLSAAGRILVASVVMAAVCYGVRLEMSGRIGTWQLQDGDFRQAGALAARLKTGADPVSQYLYTRLSNDTRKIIDDFQASGWNEEAARRGLVTDLNSIINGPCIYDAKLCDKMRLPEETTRLIKKVTPADSARLNRILLSAAYPRQINEGPTGGPYTLREKDIEDAGKMAMQLAGFDNPMSRYLMDRLSRETRKLLAPTTMPYSLMHNLNTIISHERIYDDSRFAGVTMPASVRAIAKKATGGNQLIEANRLLLEAVYSKEILPRPRDRVEGRLTSLLTVLVAMLLGGIVYFGLLRLLRVEEADFVWNMIRRKVLRRAG